MSVSSLSSLGSLRLQAQQRADLENNPSVSIPEWNNYLSQSYKELYDILVAAYGNDYYMKTPYQFQVASSSFYDLPDDFYKLLGVDLQYSASPTGWVTLKRFEFIQRNEYAYPNSAINLLGYTNLKYRLAGDQLELIPLPMANQLMQLWYIPQPTSLQFNLTCATTGGSSVIVVPDSSALVVGMSCYGPATQGTVLVSAIDNTTNQVTLSAPVNATQPVVILSFWIDSVTVNGISGWDEYIIIDAAIKANIKQEEDVTELKVQKAAMLARVEGMAEARDAGQAMHVSDVLSINGSWGGGDDGGGWGNGGVGY